MNVLLVYSSRTGNTKKLCDGVYRNIKNLVTVDFLTVKEVSDYSKYDLIIAGFWIDRGTANKEAGKFIAKIKNKKIAFLATLGAAPDSEHGQKTIKKLPNIVDKTNQYFGVVLARGRVAEKLIKRIKLLPLPNSIKDQMYDAGINSREPNEEEIKKATEFIKEIIKKIEDQ